MDKINKKMVLFAIFVFVVVFTVFQIFFKSGDFLEISKSMNVLNLYENSTQIENDLINEDDVSSDKIVVYVTGAVKNEGVYELDYNSRVVDCIEAAGGFTDEADLSNVNLACLLDDGVKVCVPKKGDVSNEIGDISDVVISSGSGVIYEEKSDAKTGTSLNSSSKNDFYNKKVNINTASQSELETLPGIGSATALKILDYRKQNGKFKSVDDIKKVKGIGDSKFSNIKDLIIV